jgi:hypothetical protein
MGVSMCFLVSCAHLPLAFSPPQTTVGGLMVSDSEQVKRRAKRRTLTVLLTTTVVFSLLLYPGYHAMMASALILQAPEAERYAKLNLFGVSLISYPVLTPLSIVTSWILYALKKYQAALCVSLLPALVLLTILFSFLLLEI